MKKIYLLPVFLLLVHFSQAEGTKEIRPDSSYFGCLQINDIQRPFALESNTDPLHRLYFRINDYTKEKVYLGFNHVKVSTETATYRIKDPNGNTVKARANVPTSGTGFIKYYSQAMAGPKISNLPATGYTPVVFTPTMNGDFYIEFTTSLAGTNTAYHLDLFDLTVATTTANRIKGRLWSNCWDLNLKSYTNRFWGKFYSLTDDGYVTEFNMNGIQPFGFTVSCNNSGTATSGLNDENRKSIDGNSTRPQYKIFLNDPDPICFPSGITPVIIENLALVDTPFVNEPAIFTVKMNKTGTIEMIIELNDTAGYQPNSRDVILVQTVNANQKDSIIWDGKDGKGVFVNSEDLVVSSADFYCGVTHFPLYDPETNEYGYIVNRIRPVAGPCKIYWDDSNFTDGTTNVVGEYGPTHTWPYFFGDVRTMSNWWDGYRIDAMAAFSWSFKESESMPIELYSFTASVVDQHVEIKWITSSEINNDYFVIERANAASDFQQIFKVSGAGNSNSQKEYFAFDYTPVDGPALYRLKQVDFDGKFTYSDPVYVNINIEDLSYSIYPNPINSNNTEVSIAQAPKGNTEVIVYDEKGQKVYQKSYCNDANCVIKLNFDDYQNGTYILYVKSGAKEFKTKLVKED